MKAVVINLDGESKRMAFQAAQLDDLEIEYERLSASAIKDPTDPFYQKYHDTWERPLSLSEVSCFLSHKNIWERVSQGEAPVLVLEDDAFLAKKIQCLLSKLEGLTGLDYVNLETRYKRRRLIHKSPTQSICGTSLYRLYQGRSGTGGYILWPSGAQKLLVRMKKEGIGLVDKFINTTYDLESYQTSPALLIQLDQCETHQVESPLETKSSIATGSRNKSGNVPWKYRSRRIKGQLIIGLNHLRHVYHARQQKIGVSSCFFEEKK